jgi:uncharacterized linocin/CFP29 family protein
MSKKFLQRDDVPFKEEIWEKIDDTVVEAAKSQLSARKLLHMEGPYGLGFRFIEGSNIIQEESGETNISSNQVTPIVQIQNSFTLPVSDIASYEQFGKPLNFKPVVEAAVACAKQEENILYNGSKNLGVTGLLNTKGTQSIKLQPWDKVGNAIDDIISALTKLDESGFHGPYALGLSAQHYNMLYRRYPNGNMTELSHIESIITKKIVKIPNISQGGVVLAYGRQYASIVFGQDLMTAFIGPSESNYEFNLSETLTLRLLQPSAVCVLKHT